MTAVKYNLKLVNDLLEHRNILCLYYAGTISAKSKFLCLKCNYQWESTFANINHSKHPRGCPKCAHRIKHTIETVGTYCQNKSFKCKKWSGQAGSKSVWKCNCGHEWIATFQSILSTGCGCPKCVGKARRTLADAFELCRDRTIKPIAEEWGGGSAKKSGWICECGYSWKATFHNVSAGKGCPKCFNQKYIYRGISFDSSWELIFYLYHLKLGSNIIRLNGRQKEHSFEYEFNGKKCKWYPDFLIDGIYYEIKPIRGFHNKDILKSKAKETAYPDIKWVRDTEIKEMRKIIGDVLRYKNNKKKKVS